MRQRSPFWESSEKAALWPSAGRSSVSSMLLASATIAT
jgi:hypothetical protein